MHEQTSINFILMTRSTWMQRKWSPIENISACHTSEEARTMADSEFQHFVLMAFYNGKRGEDPVSKVTAKYLIVSLAMVMFLSHMSGLSETETSILIVGRDHK